MQKKWVGNMEELKMIKMIRDCFKNVQLDNEDVNLIINEINKNKLKFEKEIMDYLNWLKNEMIKRTIDDSEFDEG